MRNQERDPDPDDNDPYDRARNSGVVSYNPYSLGPGATRKMRDWHIVRQRENNSARTWVDLDETES